MSYRFEGKVVLVTGAGRGLGRAFAEYFATLGAQVVVNGLGSPDDNDPKQSGVEATVSRIVSRQGKAVGYVGSVGEAQTIIDFCMSQFKRVDIVVHAAGFVRDQSFAKMTDEDWESVLDVHLTAAYKLAQACWPVFMGQGGGKLLFIGSASGLYGNFGQANYASAKMGLLGLTKTLALEGARHEIHTNCVAPIGATSMNRHLLSAQQCQEFSADKISPLIAWLCHDACNESGSLFEAAGGWFGKVHIARSGGARPPIDGGIDAVAQQWTDITSTQSLDCIHSLNESMARMK